MNAFAERLIFFMICIQMGAIIVNNTQIIPGMTLTSGQVNNAFIGGFGTGPVFVWFNNALTQINTSITIIQLSINTLNIWALVANIFLVFFNLLLAASDLFVILLGILFGVLAGGIIFWPAVISVIDPVDAPLWGGLLGSLQTIIIIYSLGTELLEILGSKGKSLATGGAAGQ